MSGSSGGASYGDCVASLRSSLNYLESSVQTLDSGVSDFPRLVNVLKSVRVSVSTLMELKLFHATIVDYL
jgi:hypothetical protein